MPTSETPTNETSTNPKITFPTKAASDRFDETRQALRNTECDLFFDIYEEQWVVYNNRPFPFDGPQQFFVTLEDLRECEDFKELFEEDTE